MESSVTQTFEFSASYSRGEKVLGGNYRLRAVFGGLSEAEEFRLRQRIQEELIQKVHSRDLSRDVDFLKGVVLNDEALLRSFWPIVALAAAPAPLRSLSLERGRTTRWTLADPGADPHAAR